VQRRGRRGGKLKVIDAVARQGLFIDIEAEARHVRDENSAVLELEGLLAMQQRKEIGGPPSGRGG
jgi:hypothetical protein